MKPLIYQYRMQWRELLQCVEFADTDKLFSMPADKRTEDYITGRFG